MFRVGDEVLSQSDNNYTLYKTGEFERAAEVLLDMAEESDVYSQWWDIDFITIELEEV